jgi:hypothetical protein
MMPGCKHVLIIRTITLARRAPWGRMQDDHVYPALGDRTSPIEWDKCGKPDQGPRPERGDPRHPVRCAL